MSVAVDVREHWRGDWMATTVGWIMQRGPREWLNLELVSMLNGLPKDARILELGCGDGCNLALLHDEGWHNLEGVDACETLILQAHDRYPQLAGCPLHIGLIEDFVPTMGDYDLVFTVGTLAALPSAEMLPLIADHTKVMVTFEDEASDTPLHFPRNYRQVFEQTGMRQTVAWAGVFKPVNWRYHARRFEH